MCAPDKLIFDFFQLLGANEQVGRLTSKRSPSNIDPAVADSGYLKSLGLPNVALNFDGIERILENGILTKKGKAYFFLYVLRNLMFFLEKAKYYRLISSSTRRDS